MATEQRTCKVIDQFIKSLNTQQKNFLKLISKATIQCLLAFLAFIVRNPTLLSQFKTFVAGINALIDLAVSSLQLFLAQLDVLSLFINAVLQPFKALLSQLDGFLGIMPFKEFMNCPPIAAMFKWVKDLQKGALNKLGKIPPLNKIKAVAEYIQMLQFQLERIQKLKKKILLLADQLHLLKRFFQVLLDAIEQCFNDLVPPIPG